jgi:hypothetical protein
MVLMGRLEEAAYFSLEYIKAILGNGQEFFGLETPLLAITPSVYLPFNTLEILILELEYASKDDQTYLEVYNFCSCIIIVKIMYIYYKLKF